MGLEEKEIVMGSYYVCRKPEHQRLIILRRRYLCKKRVSNNKEKGWRVTVGEHECGAKSALSKTRYGANIYLVAIVHQTSIHMHASSSPSMHTYRFWSDANRCIVVCVIVWMDIWSEGCSEGKTQQRHLKASLHSCLNGYNVVVKVSIRVEN